jgi:hypothetical protein
MHSRDSSSLINITERNTRAGTSRSYKCLGSSILLISSPGSFLVVLKGQVKTVRRQYNSDLRLCSNHERDIPFQVHCKRCSAELLSNVPFAFPQIPKNLGSHLLRPARIIWMI